MLPTASMVPTLKPGDRFVVNRLARPARWDLIVYRSGGPQSPLYTKRLVALPGERLRFDNGDIYINDQRMPAPPVVAGRYHAWLPAIPTWQSRYHDGETIVLAEHQFFVVGDNVDVSGDSRIYGPSDEPSIIGVVDFVFWPPSSAGCEIAGNA